MFEKTKLWERRGGGNRRGEGRGGGGKGAAGGGDLPFQRGGWLPACVCGCAATSDPPQNGPHARHDERKRRGGGWQELEFEQ